MFLVYNLKNQSQDCQARQSSSKKIIFKCHQICITWMGIEIDKNLSQDDHKCSNFFPRIPIKLVKTENKKNGVGPFQSFLYTLLLKT